MCVAKMLELIKFILSTITFKVKSIRLCASNDDAEGEGQLRETQQTFLSTENMIECVKA